MRVGKEGLLRRWSALQPLCPLGETMRLLRRSREKSLSRTERACCSAVLRLAGWDRSAPAIRSSDCSTAAADSCSSFNSRCCYCRRRSCRSIRIWTSWRRWSHRIRRAECDCCGCRRSRSRGSCCCGGSGLPGSFSAAQYCGFGTSSRLCRWSSARGRRLPWLQWLQRNSPSGACQAAPHSAVAATTALPVAGHSPVRDDDCEAHWL